jgi:hypothetical protein
VFRVLVFRCRVQGAGCRTPQVASWPYGHAQLRSQLVDIAILLSQCQPTKQVRWMGVWVCRVSSVGGVQAYGPTSIMTMLTWIVHVLLLQLLQVRCYVSQPCQYGMCTGRGRCVAIGCLWQ